jgi:hypothetical protein
LNRKSIWTGRDANFIAPFQRSGTAYKLRHRRPAAGVQDATGDIAVAPASRHAQAHAGMHAIRRATVQPHDLVYSRQAHALRTGLHGYACGNSLHGPLLLLRPCLRIQNNVARDDLPAAAGNDRFGPFAIRIATDDASAADPEGHGICKLIQDIH